MSPAPKLPKGQGAGKTSDFPHAKVWKWDWLGQAAQIIHDNSGYHPGSNGHGEARLIGPEENPRRLIICIALQFRAKGKARTNAPRASEAGNRLERLSNASNEMADAIGALDDWSLAAMYEDVAGFDARLGSIGPHGIHLPSPATDDPKREELRALTQGLRTIANQAAKAATNLRHEERGGLTDLEVESRGTELTFLVRTCAELLRRFDIPVAYQPESVLQEVTQAIHGLATGTDAIHLGETFRRIIETDAEIERLNSDIANGLRSFGRISLSYLMDQDRMGTPPVIPPPPDESLTSAVLAIGQRRTRLQLGALLPRKRRKA